MTTELPTVQMRTAGRSQSEFDPIQFRMSFYPVISGLSVISPSDIRYAVNLALMAKSEKRTIYFIGNGGSAAISSHMAADFLKNGGIAAQCFNDGALTTCLANDLGYDQVFAKPMSMHGRQDDLLVAISSSGKSPSILNAAQLARDLRMRIITLSGFAADNPLHQMGDVNFYIPSSKYGVVEVCHHAICHAILDAVIDAGN